MGPASKPVEKIEFVGPAGRVMGMASQEEALKKRGYERADAEVALSEFEEFEESEDED